jgi:hypothetical protein
MRTIVAAARVALIAAATVPILAQTAPPRAAATPVDLSGNWGYAIGNSFSPRGTAQDAGTPADGVPYQPWALEKFKSHHTMSGPNATFASRDANLEVTDGSDPVEQCIPHGVPRILTWPAKFKFVQGPEVVYILYEYGPSWRPVWLNKPHPPADELDSTFWGHSTGRYEGADTLVVDTVGLNEKTWLDDVGRPHTDKLHVIERYRRLDKNRLEVTLTIDDPGAYTAPFTYGPRTVQLRTTDFGAALWTCTIDNNKKFFNDNTNPTLRR